MSRLKNITAIVINKRDFMENDLALTLLDEEGNRIEAMVKGAGSRKSKRRRHLERMNLIKGTLYKGKTHLYLQDVECQQSFTVIKDDFDRIMQASVLLELIQRSILEDDPHPEIYHLLKDSFTEFNQKSAEQHILDISLVQLAKHLGFLPNFKECSQCHEEKIKENLHWDKDHGTLHCDNCGPVRSPLELKYRKAMEFFKRTHIHDAAKLKLNESEQSIVRNLCYQLFEAHLQTPLKSLSL